MRILSRVPTGHAAQFVAVCQCTMWHSTLSVDGNLHCTVPSQANKNIMQPLLVHQKEAFVCAHLVGMETD